MRGMKAAARGLRKARRIMNDTGAHWTQGHLWVRASGRGKYRQPDRYCHLGGLQMAIFGAISEDGSDPTGAYIPNRYKRPAYVAAILASAEAIDGRKGKDLAARYERLQTDERYRKRYLSDHLYGNQEHPEWDVLDNAEGVIISHNDAHDTEWPAVEAVLLQAAESLEVLADPPAAVE
jgi:hypothetical protein